MLEQLGRAGGVAPNEFVENDLQAADYAAQADPMVVTALLARALQLGLQQLVPGYENESLYFRPLPEDYEHHVSNWV